MVDFSLNGKIALVTGATSGIGRRQALTLAEAGASVIVIGRRKKQLNDVASEIRSMNREAAVLSADLSDLDSLTHVAEHAISFFGKVDILVNAAGVNLRQAIDKISLDDWHLTINLNLAAPFFLARGLVPEMQKAGWGRIINIASLQSTRAFANSLPYGASKGGIAQLTRAMAEAWSKEGINCNAIAPGFFPTELTSSIFKNPLALKKLENQTAIGRNGELSDIDGLTVFLASPASDYITGQVINIDGGFTAK